ncbi:hypothetical protein DERF_001754 [Dermatophagoides farinae]|uniref:Uncharacterized protein n=1 Tax=Dermatophagoides farinae TaxID=6954 RepID=A0A922IA56_DERFA|nr:hypothetical protein DERF_001754 [Dermatophagoides farinae]
MSTFSQSTKIVPGAFNAMKSLHRAKNVYCYHNRNVLFERNEEKERMVKRRHLEMLGGLGSLD